MEQLKEETSKIVSGGCENVQAIVENKSMPQQLAYNVFPHIGSFTECDYTNEEWKLVKETRKIMHDDKIKISATTAGSRCAPDIRNRFILKQKKQ